MTIDVKYEAFSKARDQLAQMNAILRCAELASDDPVEMVLSLVCREIENILCDMDGWIRKETA